jgi:hypothetical protein
MVTRGLVALAMLAPAILATSCASSSYHYVASSSTGTFFKVPHAWHVYGKPQVLADPGQLGPRGSSSDRLLVEFDASPKPEAGHDFVTSSYPFGIARVRQLSLQEHDQYSLAALRNEVLPVDNLLSQDPNSVQAVSAPKLLTRGGLRGTKLEFTVHVNSTTFTVEQIGYIDTKTENVWYLIVGCDETCYRHYSGDIHRVVDSWTVEGK